MSLTKTISTVKQISYPAFSIIEESTKEDVELTFDINQWLITGDSTCDVIFLVSSASGQVTGSYRGSYSFTDKDNPLDTIYSQLEKELEYLYT